ncbi:hypothetical protein ACLB2K_073551 [Fragaria x ananassa]
MVFHHLPEPQNLKPESQSRNYQPPNSKTPNRTNLPHLHLPADLFISQSLQILIQSHSTLQILRIPLFGVTQPLAVPKPCLDFLNSKPPANYVAGPGRGATGFTTRSDIVEHTIGGAFGTDLLGLGVAAGSRRRRKTTARRKVTMRSSEESEDRLG